MILNLSYKAVKTGFCREVLKALDNIWTSPDEYVWRNIFKKNFRVNRKYDREQRDLTLSLEF